MTARAAMYAGIALVVAVGVWWTMPWLLEWVGLGEFVFVGRFCGVVVTMSVLERVFDHCVPAESSH